MGTQEDLDLAKLVLFCGFFTKGIPLLFYCIYTLLKLFEKVKLAILFLSVLIILSDITWLFGQASFVVALSYKLHGHSIKSNDYFQAKGFIVGFSLLFSNMAYCFFVVKYWASSLRLHNVTKSEPVDKHDLLITAVFWFLSIFIVFLVIIYIVFNWYYYPWMWIPLNWDTSLLYCASIFWFGFALDAFLRMKKISEHLGTEIDSKNMAYLLTSYGLMAFSGILYALETYVFYNG